LQLINSYCKPQLLYATEYLQLSHTAIKKLKSAWLCALSKIFCVKGSYLDFRLSVKCFSDILLRPRLPVDTRSQAVAKIADRTDSQHLRRSRDVIGHVTIR